MLVTGETRGMLGWGWVYPGPHKALRERMTWMQRPQCQSVDLRVALVCSPIAAALHHGAGSRIKAVPLSRKATTIPAYGRS